MKTPQLIAPIAVGLLSLGLSVPLAATPIESIPIEEIRPGMVGEGWSVFSGHTIEPFKVHILGVLRNFGPNRNMILARLEGANLEHTGVIAGMSGSPVYVDDKLIGAVAYGFPFAKDPIAGITPIQEMVDATATPSRARRRVSLQFPLVAEQLSAQLGVTPTAIPVASTGLATSDVAMAHLSPYLGQNLIPIATPASIHGLSGEAYEAIAPILRSLGVEPVLGPSGAFGWNGFETSPQSATSPPESQSSEGPSPAGSASPLRPGDAVGVGLVTGDLDIVATGTVTHIDELTGAVYAFGHPLFNLGPIQYPMMRSEIHLVLPSLMNSFKMASAGETIGTWTQDRAVAIKGLTNIRPRMIPVTVDIKTSREQEKNYSLEIIDDELFTPVLTYSALIAILHSIERQFGTQTLKLSAWITTNEEKRINVNDIFASQQASMLASAMVAAPLSFLMTNEFETVQVQKVEITVEAEETIQSANLVRAWLDTDEVAPGTNVELKLLLRSYRGEESLKTISVQIPANVGTGRLQLLVADSETMSAIERRANGPNYVPRDVGQLVRAINAFRKNSRLYIRLSRPDRAGAVVAGEYMTSLPPSVVSVLSADDSSGSYRPLRNATIHEQEIATEYDVAGSRTLSLTVKRP